MFSEPPRCTVHVADPDAWFMMFQEKIRKLFKDDTDDLRTDMMIAMGREVYKSSLIVNKGEPR